MAAIALTPSMELTEMTDSNKDEPINDVDAYIKSMGDLLTKERKKLGLSQEDIGDHIVKTNGQVGLSQRTMSNIETGKNHMLPYYIQYANLVGIDFAVLVAKARLLTQINLMEVPNISTS